MAFDYSKFLSRFIEEAAAHCARLSQGLLNLEKAADDPETLNDLFRSAHTIKGSARMMKLSGITEVAHKMEDVLDALRSGKITLIATTTDLLLQGVDLLTAMLARMRGGDSNPEASAELCEALSLVAAGAITAESSPAPPLIADPPPAATPAAPMATKVPVSAEKARTPAPLPLTNPDAGHHEYLRVHAGKLDELIGLMGEIVAEHGRFRRQLGCLRTLEQRRGEQTAAVAELLNNQDEAYRGLSEKGIALQLALRQTVKALHDGSLLQDHLLSDLQETALRLRMQPLTIIFEPLRRTVRDLAREQGKEIDFIVEGEETELDRRIIERLGDSLLHMIRNGLDHGIENAAERLAADKPAKGTIKLAACYDRGCVTIALSDDGRGLNIELIGQKAVEKKIISPESLAGMSKAEITNLIFRPGFSTSPIITDLSGRGVGMDVVRKNIVDELKGSVLVESKQGVGTTIQMRLPLNLAVFPLFTVTAADRVCALPATALVEVLSIPRRDLIDIVDRQAIRLREQIIPVEELGILLGLAREDTSAQQLNIAIVRDGEEKLGLIVQELIGRDEMVVKPLPLHLQGLQLVGGVTIGDRNEIINVLRIPELLLRARASSQAPAATVAKDITARRMVLVVDDSLNTREIEKSILEAHGYTVATAEDGLEALDKTRDLLYDLVITDVEMPRLDGFSLTERLREDPRYRHIPIIIVTSRQKEEDKRRGVTAGANAYIVKGAFDQSNLLETVRALIG